MKSKKMFLIAVLLLGLLNASAALAGGSSGGGGQAGNKGSKSQVCSQKDHVRESGSGAAGN